ncbi:MAG: serpin family protein, partial [Allobaculum sp.]|nr:serpin family protein [Allobaculum sp.]
MKPFRSFLSALCCAALCGCSSSTQENTSANVSSDSTSTVSSSVVSQEEDLIALTQQKGYDDFSWTLFQNTLEDKENTLISPLSLFFALGLTANGAQDETLKQMESVLGMSLEECNALCATLLAQFAANPKAQLQLANCIWFNPEEVGSLQQNFESVAIEDYSGQLFIDPLNENSVEKINTWVASHTNQMILNMVDTLPTNLAMILINALAFEASWQSAYSTDDVSTMDFNNADQTTTSIQMMTKTEYAYLENQGFKGFVKGYDEGHFALAVLLPEDENESLEEALRKVESQEFLNSLFSSQYREVHTGLPQFSFETSMDLKEALQKAGMLQAFETDANFSNMAQEPLYVGEVKQKAKIEMDLNGTKAAAATEVQMMAMGALNPEEAAEVICNRPFVYFLLDTDHSIPVLMGTV